MKRANLHLGAWPAALLALAIPASAHADGWWHGAFVVERLEGPGENADVAERRTTPGAFLDLRLQKNEVARLFASNGARFLLRGPGAFNVERFEQAAFDAASRQPVDWAREPSRTRFIAGFDGLLWIADLTSLREGSRFVAEFPYGTLTSGSAIWAVRSEFIERKRSHRFTIEVERGDVRFSTLQGDVYELGPGQRLTGAGSLLTPSITLSQTGPVAEKRFGRVTAERGEPPDWSTFEPHLRPIKRAERGADEGEETAASRAVRGAGRPLMIPHPPSPPPIAPFRGAVERLRPRTPAMREALERAASEAVVPESRPEDRGDA